MIFAITSLIYLLIFLPYLYRKYMNTYSRFRLHVFLFVLRKAHDCFMLFLKLFLIDLTLIII